jgi:hypothetical protein
MTIRISIGIGLQIIKRAKEFATTPFTKRVRTDLSLLALQFSEGSWRAIIEITHHYPYY